MSSTSATRRESAVGAPNANTSHKRRIRRRVPKGAQVVVVTRTNRGSPKTESSESESDASVVDISDGRENPKYELQAMDDPDLDNINYALDKEGSEQGSGNPKLDRSLVDNSQLNPKYELQAMDDPNLDNIDYALDKEGSATGNVNPKVDRSLVDNSQLNPKYELQAMDDPNLDNIDYALDKEGSETGNVKPELDSSPVDNSQLSVDKRSTRQSTAHTPSWIDQPELFNTQVYEKRKDYQKLVGLCKGNWNQKYELRAVDDPDLDFIDYELDKEVVERTAEGHKKWDDMWSKSGLNTDGFKIDYIVASTSRKLGEMLASELLIKYTDYPVPSWEPKRVVKPKALVVEAFRVRLLDLDLIEIRLRAELGDVVFAKTYPNRYLQSEAGAGRGGYVTGKRARYFNYLRAVEWRMRFVCDRFDIAEIYVEDWTNGPCDGAALLRLFEFVVHLMNSDEVEQAVEEHEQLEQDACAASCPQCESKGGDGQCCSMKGPSCRSHTAAMVTIECTKGCRCNHKECRNRVLQKGRQMALCIFRHEQKGWSIRCVQEIPKDGFVTEFVGEVNTAATVGKGASYELRMQCALRDAQGKKMAEPFTISAYKKGNESRFLNHSCNPNLRRGMTVVERYGCFYHRIGFNTTRAIMAGEELTYNYFPGPGINFDPKAIFKFCKCNSENCKFTAEKLRAIREKNGEEPSEEEEEVEEKIEEDGPIEMMDCFNPSDDQMLVASAAATTEKKKRGRPSKNMKRKAVDSIDKEEEKEKKEDKKRGRKTAREDMRRKEEEKREKRRDSTSPDERERMKKKEARRKKIRSFGMMSDEENELINKKRMKKENGENEKEKKEEKKEEKKGRKKTASFLKTSVPVQEVRGRLRREPSPLEIIEGKQTYQDVVRMTLARGMVPVVPEGARATADEELADIIRKSNRYSPSTSPTSSDAECDGEKKASSKTSSSDCKIVSSPSSESVRTALAREYSSLDPSLYSTRRRFRRSSSDEYDGPSTSRR